MGRKQLRLDVSAARQRPPPCISAIDLGDDDQVLFSFTSDTHGVVTTLLELWIDVDEYPSNHSCMITSRNDMLPSFSNAFKPLQALVRNLRVLEALHEISAGLQQALDGCQVHDDLQSDSNSLDDGSEIASDLEDENIMPMQHGPLHTALVLSRINPAAILAKAKEDLRTTKAAGFKVGIIGDLANSGIISIGICISKLGISEEAMLAWDLKPKTYFVLLIRFLHGYRDISIVRSMSKLEGDVEVRSGVCFTYKPNRESAFNAFSLETPTRKDESVEIRTPKKGNDDLLPHFISGPLEDLFKNKFCQTVRFRADFQVGWTAAEDAVHTSQGSTTDMTSKLSALDYEAEEPHRALPDIVIADHMRSRHLGQCSLTLIAMQLALRHFVRCTEFCLVCHRKINTKFEALKPYVCSDMLCLHQYMNMGFGPSIEWEILSQPYVVDLLISFCYSQAFGGRLRDFPVGIYMKVPLLSNMPGGHSSETYRYSNAPSACISPSEEKESIRKARMMIYNPEKNELTTTADAEGILSFTKLKVNDYIALRADRMSVDGIIYCRVKEVMYPFVKLGPRNLVRTAQAGKARDLPKEPFRADVHLFQHDFDELDPLEKCKVICTLLDSLPSVQEMIKYLREESASQNSDLRSWRDRISPPALDILRWIIVSNRSCIVQVDQLMSGQSADTRRSTPDRISGMESYMQFRFAQGAPDKEQRFETAVKEHSTSKAYQTIFAWHGSELKNWHSILREGLHFKDTLNGRAFGDGVYMSSNVQTSMGYSTRSIQVTGSWSKSVLQINSALALCEVVNNPTQFVSQNPHYVVKDLDWIQVRYLLVGAKALHTKDDSTSEMIKQDPMRTPTDKNGKKIEIPVSALTRSRRAQQRGFEPWKRRSTAFGSYNNPIDLDDDDNMSIATDSEDREYLIDVLQTGSAEMPTEISDDGYYSDSMEIDDDLPLPKKQCRNYTLSKSNPSTSLTDGCLIVPGQTVFRPSPHVTADIKLLPTPSDSTPSASRALLKAFQTLVKTQEMVPTHELGWYMNPNTTENMYQWIVELHSFDASLPLAKDMSSTNTPSIVLEILFTNTFPFSPPFVRVVKPRFLPFNQGGGGHVTEGGAVCMELLTNNGWTVVSTIESVLMSIRLAMSETERPARLARMGGNRHGFPKGGQGNMYGVGEAMDGYERFCRTHGWKIPDSFRQLKAGAVRGDRY